MKINKEHNEQKMASLALFVAYMHDVHPSRAFWGLWKRSCDMPQRSLFADVSRWLTEEERDGVRFKSVPWEKDPGYPQARLFILPLLIDLRWSPSGTSSPLLCQMQGLHMSVIVPSLLPWRGNTDHNHQDFQTRFSLLPWCLLQISHLSRL